MTLRAPRLAVIALAAALAGGLAAAPSVQAAGGGVQLAQSGGSQQSYSQAKLDAFTTAAVEVSKLMQQYGPQIKQAQDNKNREKAQQIANKVRSEAETAIKQVNGITVQEYTEITQAARQNQQLKQRLTKMVRQKQQSQ
jgi:hypothetical protein